MSLVHEGHESLKQVGPQTAHLKKSNATNPGIKLLKQVWNLDFRAFVPTFLILIDWIF